MATLTRRSEQTSTSQVRRWGPAALVAAGALFALYPITRPYSDETTLAGAHAIASGAWIAAHTFAMVGFVLLCLGLLSLKTVLAGTRGGQLASGAALSAVVGAGLTLPYYGAEAFGLHAIAAIAARAAQDGDLRTLELTDQVRNGPTQLTMFGLGLLLLALSTVLAALAIRRSGVLASWSGAPLALAFLLFLPQFYTAPTFRIAHGILLAVGCVLVAVAMRRSARIAPQN